MSCKDRFHFQADMTCDGRTDIKDLMEMVKYVFFLPGDGVIYLILQAGSGAGLGLTRSSYQAGFSAGVSLILWIIILFMMQKMMGGGRR